MPLFRKTYNIYAACLQVIQNDDFQGGECHHIINHCRFLLKEEDWEVRLVHCYREGNRAADWLANQGVELDDRLQVITTIPNALGRILDEDLTGMAWPRLVNGS